MGIILKTRVSLDIKNLKDLLENNQLNETQIDTLIILLKEIND